MGEVYFTATLQRHLACPTVTAGSGTVREVLERVFADNPRLRSYLVDEHGRLRRHVNIYVDDHPVRDRVGLTDQVAAEDDVFVFQALSGG